jgi:aspartyl-tRNA(Asn)/glutamyl-tRNA(Gln) amidotransferase subunit B
MAGIAKLVADGKLAASKEIAKQLVAAAVGEKGASAEAIATKLGLLQSTDTGPVDAAIEAMLATNPPGLADYQAGKQSALGSLIGAVMKQGKGLNAKVVGERLKARLSNPS